MAEKIVYTNINPVEKRLISAVSRYTNSTVIYYGNDNKMTFSTYKKQSIPEDVTDKYTVIPPGMEYRPDKLSNKVYGLPDFWWMIMEANNMKDVLEFKSGISIRIPTKYF